MTYNFLNKEGLAYYDKNRIVPIKEGLELVQTKEDLLQLDINSIKSTNNTQESHLKLLDAKTDATNATLEQLSMSGGINSARNIIYDNSNTGFDSINVQSAISEVYKRSNPNDEEGKIYDTNDMFIVLNMDNFIWVIVDSKNNVLVGQLYDGNIYYGSDIPKLVKDYIDGKINSILGTHNISPEIDSLKEIYNFLKDFLNSDTLKQLLDLKMGIDQESRILDIENTIWPLEVSYSLNKDVLSINELNTIIVTVLVTRKGQNVTNDSEITLNGQKITNGYSFDITPTEVGNLNYVLGVKYDGLTYSNTKSIPVTYPSYFGVINQPTSVTPDLIKTLTKLILPSKKYSASVNMTYQRVVYAYPASKGVLTTIKDENGYEVIDSYTFSSIDIDNIQYYIYALTNPITISNGKQNYD